jgi:hypothetical protein
MPYIFFLQNLNTKFQGLVEKSDFSRASLGENCKNQKEIQEIHEQYKKLL